jgi:hypothetical protein
LPAGNVRGFQGAKRPRRADWPQRPRRQPVGRGRLPRLAAGDSAGKKRTQKDSMQTMRRDSEETGPSRM